MSYPDFFKLCPEWTDFFFSPEVEIDIVNILKILSESQKYYPESDNIFKCFYLTPFNNINIVFLGNEPSNNESATGLCFDIKFGNKLSIVIQNIYKELEKEGYYPTKDGNLENWTKQGILLMNTSLTVSNESHKEIWYDFMEKVFKKLSEKEFIIWVIYGNDKNSSEWSKWVNCITNKNHIIFDNKDINLFKKINKELYKKGIDNISW